MGTLIVSAEFDKNVAKALKHSAENIGSSIEEVSTETEEGAQFKNLSGVGAILRFRIN